MLFCSLNSESPTTDSQKFQLLLILGNLIEKYTLPQKRKNVFASRSRFATSDYKKIVKLLKFLIFEIIRV